MSYDCVAMLIFACSPPRVDFTSYKSAKYILEHAKEFNVVWNDGFEWLMGKGGSDFMLSGDTVFHAKQRKLMGMYMRRLCHWIVKSLYAFNACLQVLSSTICKVHISSLPQYPPWLNLGHVE